MYNKLAQMAADNFLNKGYSCSESIVQAAIDLNIVPKELLSVATSFSGGMGSGCLCGAIAGSQIVLGYLFGKGKTNTARALAPEGASAHVADVVHGPCSSQAPVAPARALAPEGASAHVADVVHGPCSSQAPVAPARALAKEFIEEFKKTHKATCCRVLTAGFDFHSPERKKHCVNMVESCANILSTMLEREMSKV